MKPTEMTAGQLARLECKIAFALRFCKMTEEEKAHFVELGEEVWKEQALRN